MIVTKPAIRYHGAKFRLAPWIIKHFPPHYCYVEPFGGAAGVLLQKPRSYAEVYNDLDGNIVNFFRVLRDPVQRAALLEQLVLTPYARDEFDLAWEPTDDPIESARRLCIRAQMGFGSSGATKGTTGFRIDTKRAYSTAQELWAEYPDQLTAVGVRFSGVLIENKPALEVMKNHDTTNTLHFVDPPYVLSTRTLDSAGRGYYRHEMTDDDHAELLKLLKSLQGMVIITGYETELYRDTLREWRVESTSSRISAGRGTSLRTEMLWMNEACQYALEESLFSIFG
jgi:DNA adenine methylase